LPDCEACEHAIVPRRYAAAGVVDTLRGLEAIDDLTVWPLTRYPHDLFLSRIWALWRNLTADDAAYVALAETLESTLVACDTRLAASVGHRATIALVKSR
jgi:predicted nucleic acid-binding protein